MKEQYVKATVEIEEFEEDIVTFSKCKNSAFQQKERCPSSNTITEPETNSFGGFSF